MKVNVWAYIVCAALCLAWPVVAGAQKSVSYGKHDLSIGLGLSTDVFNNMNLRHIVGVMTSFDEIDNDDTNATARSGYFLSYRYHFDRPWTVGATVFYKPYKENLGQDKTDNHYWQYLTGLTFEGTYTYVNKRVFRMYALAGTGPYWVRQKWQHTEKEATTCDTQSSVRLTWQLSPLCLEVGKSVGIRMEYGYGYKGIGSLSLYARF